MIPDRMPSGASRGEKRVFEILQRLPDDYIVYYEPLVSDRYPDFVVICPDLGLLVIEVKGWYPADIRAADPNDVQVERRRQVTKERHPIRQAREYMYGLMDSCREHRDFRVLLHEDGPHQNRFIFPFGHFAVLSNITTEQLVNHELGDLRPVFPPSRVVTRDVLQEWDELTSDDLCQAVKRCFDPFWQIEALSKHQTDVLRAIIHPEICLRKSAAGLATSESSILPQLTIATLDLRQERHARSLGSGHRIIYGVAGSGKTVILLARARLVAREDPDSRYLLLCYNVSLRAYLEHALRDVPNIVVRHFDGWSIENGVRRGQEEENESLGNRLLAHLRDGYGQSRQFDGVFIDEGQDFHTTWFQCSLEAMKEPNDGDLVIVSDASQGLYRRLGVSWVSLGINARGRTVSAQFDLNRNYRNTREILRLAKPFAASPATDETADGMLVLPVDPELALRSGQVPLLIRCQGFAEECNTAAALVRGLLGGVWHGAAAYEPFLPGEIGILYPYLSARRKATFQRFIDELRTVGDVVWLNEDRDARRRVNAPGVKVQTIHSAKGLQYRTVILLWADLLPREFADSEPEAERSLMYVALTRAEELLAITHSGESAFIDELRIPGAIETA